MTARQVRHRIEYGFVMAVRAVVGVVPATVARSIGAAVATRNVRDYRAIQAIRPFALLTVP